MVNGIKIGELRKACDLTQEELAEKTMSTRSMISQIEAGIKQPSVPHLVLIAKILGVKLDELVR